METYRKQKLFIVALLSFIVVFSGIYFLFYSNRLKDLNVLLITIDTLRPDHMSCYGYKRKTTPNIDKLAKGGVVFTQAISQSSWTPPSITSILTSTYPHTHRVNNFGVSLNHSLQTLPIILKDKGYYLGLISARGRLAEFHFPELEKEFDTFYPSSSKYILADEVTKNAIKWLRLNKEKKFFLWLFYLDPHTPYRPPLPYDKLYVNDKLINENNKYVPLADESKGIYDGYGVIPRITSVKDITDINYYISQYDGEIRFVDEQIGMVLTELKKIKLYDNTLIVITSDHGEYMGEHNFYFVHAGPLYDAVIRVPLILKCDDILPKDKVINQQVAHIDIMPTVLNLLNIKTNIKTSGISLVPMILKDRSCPSRIILSELFDVPENPNNAKITFRALRTDGWKLICNLKDGKYELYNLKRDPAESINLVETEREKFKFLKQRLDNYMKNWTLTKTTKPVRPLDEETKEKLKGLGYIQ